MSRGKRVITGFLFEKACFRAPFMDYLFEIIHFPVMNIYLQSKGAERFSKSFMLKEE